MVEYKGPVSGLGRYVQRFVVVGNEVRVSEPDDFTAQHTRLANEIPGLYDELSRRRDNEPETIDAGFAETFGRERRIELSLDSRGLRLPVESVSKKARKRSVTLFQKLSPGYKVKAIPERE